MGSGQVSHRMAPAMAACVESRLWEIDIVKVIEEWESNIRE
jgi:hypothetical protein